MIAYFISLYLLIFWMLVLIEKGVKYKVRKLKTFPTISICIPAYNEGKNIKETIKSVVGLDYPKEKIEIFVVNDGSKDNTQKEAEKAIKQYSDRNIILLNQKNKGKGAAMNSALKIATGEYFVCLDADSIVDKKALKIMLPHFYHKNIVSVLPVLKVQHKSNLIRKIQYCEYLVNFFYKRIMSRLNCVHVTPGPFAIYRREIIQKIGGFDENNLVEDLEMAFRLQKANFEIVQLLNPNILTKAPKNYLQFYRQRNRWYKGSLLNVFKYRKLVFNKAYGDFGMLQLPMIFISAFTSITLFIILIFWQVLKPLMQKAYDLSYVKFDVIPLVSKGIKNYSFLNLNYVPIFYGILILVLGIIFLILAHHHTGEKIRYNKKSILFYLLLYPFMIAIVWFGVLFDLIRGKIQKW